MLYYKSDLTHHPAQERERERETPNSKRFGACLPKAGEDFRSRRLLLETALGLPPATIGVEHSFDRGALSVIWANDESSNDAV